MSDFIQLYQGGARLLPWVLTCRTSSTRCRGCSRRPWCWRTATSTWWCSPRTPTRWTRSGSGRSWPPLRRRRSRVVRGVRDRHHGRGPSARPPTPPAGSSPALPAGTLERRHLRLPLGARRAPPPRRRGAGARDAPRGPRRHGHGPARPHPAEPRRPGARPADRRPGRRRGGRGGDRRARRPRPRRAGVRGGARPRRCSAIRRRSTSGGCPGRSSRSPPTGTSSCSCRPPWPFRDVARDARLLYTERLEPGAARRRGGGGRRRPAGSHRGSAAACARRGSPPGWPTSVPRLRPVAAWADLGVHRLLACGPRRALREGAVDAAVDPLLDRPELAATAAAFLDHAGNVAARRDGAGDPPADLVLPAAPHRGADRPRPGRRPGPPAAAPRPHAGAAPAVTVRCDTAAVCQQVSPAGVNPEEWRNGPSGRPPARSFRPPRHVRYLSRKRL